MTPTHKVDKTATEKPEYVSNGKGKARVYIPKCHATTADVKPSFPTHSHETLQPVTVPVGVKVGEPVEIYYRPYSDDNGEKEGNWSLSHDFKQTAPHEYETTKKAYPDLFKMACLTLPEPATEQPEQVAELKQAHMKNQEQLKNCPFCSSEAKIEQTGKNQATVKCKKCLIWIKQRTKLFGIEWLTDTLIKDWNKRVGYCIALLNPPESAGVDEALIAKLKEEIDWNEKAESDPYCICLPSEMGVRLTISEAKQVLAALHNPAPSQAAVDEFEALSKAGDWLSDIGVTEILNSLHASGNCIAEINPAPPQGDAPKASITYDNAEKLKKELFAYMTQDLNVTPLDQEMSEIIALVLNYTEQQGDADGWIDFKPASPRTK